MVFKLALLSFVVLLFVVFAYMPVLAENQCIPLPAGTAPNESSWGWTERNYPPEDLIIEAENQNGQLVTVGARKYYINDNGMKLGVYSYFGKVGFKAWSCDKNRDPITKDTPDHMIAIPRLDGSWFAEHAQSPDKVEVVFGTDGNPQSVHITLHRVEAIINK